ncbi:PadR family transcriptional regulator [Cellulomonas gelida]|uniref:PadR family transcriptional regulator n=1 Tax=Cellulomonas gelida TaxID=1712 RepID=A0A4Y3KMP8_9CELL|nr:PadR family transcriptional regulator [Cellulomonas gelida]GGL20167.1 PadR family transcriptional regulator [Cellulomonas gelida]
MMCDTQYCVCVTDDETWEIHRQELRRGTVVLACLRLLEQPGYGYGLLEELAARGFETDANTLYPLLRRLEKQGHLTSEWNTDESRPRKFYRTSAAGRQLARTLTDELRAIAAAVDALPDKE